MSEEAKQGIERRRDVRVPARLQVRYRLGGLEQFVERYSANVSYNGVFVVTNEALALGTEVRFELATEDGEVALAGSGIVRWVRPDTGSAAQPAGVGLQFTSLSDAHRERVRALVDRYVAQKLAGVDPMPTELAGAASPKPELLPWAAPAASAPPKISGGKVVVGLLVAIVLVGFAIWALFHK